MSTAVKINPDLLKTIKKIAKNENTTENKVLNKVIEKGLEKLESETTKDKVERLALNTDRVNQNKKDKKTSISELIGLFETEKPINPVEARRKIHNKGI